MNEKFPGQSQQIIESVPGMEHVSDEGSPRINPGQPVPVENFTGDTSKVLGHPNNPVAKIAEAYAQLDREVLVPQSEGELIEVPEHLKAQ